MNINDIFYQVTSNLTGGVVTDYGTMIAGLVFILVLMAGFDLLKDLLVYSVENRKAERNFSTAETYRSMRDLSDGGSIEYDYYNALYRKHLNRSASISSRTGKTFSSVEDDLF